MSPPGRFQEVAERQLVLFREDEAELLGEVEEALDAYNGASRDEAEERYGEFVDLVDAGREVLLDMRDGFAASLDEEAAEEYRLVFDDLVRKRFPRFGLELD
ncbi:MAG: hypothetical protein ACR2L0_01110 [Gaiellaceae bacterium]